MSDTKHPADEIGKALVRVSGILASLINCYDKKEKVFDLGSGFVFEAINNVDRMLTQASDSLRVLYEEYDLGLLGEENEDDDSAESEELEPVVAEASEEIEDEADESLEEEHRAVAPQSRPQGMVTEAASAVADVDPTMPFVDFLDTPEPIARLSDRLDAILERFPQEPIPVKPPQPAQDPAKTYAEFLDRLTAMADAAATEAIRAGKQDVTLAPVLDSLRADVKRLRSVA